MSKFKHAVEIIKAIGENPDMVETRETFSGEWKTLTPRDIEGNLPLSSYDNNTWFLLKPTPKMVPLGPDVIRPGMAFRATGCVDWYPFDGVSKSTIRINHSWISYEDLRRNWEYSTDGVTWHRCEKESKE